MNLHTRPDGPTPDLFLFVHGLSGHGYKTWRDKPQMMFNGSYDDPVDIATLDYPSGFRAIFRGGSNLDAPISQLSTAFAELKQLHGYESIYIVAHSLGGIITQAALKKHLQGPGNPLITPIAAVVLFASPRAGSAWARLTMRESPLLKRGSRPLAELEEFFSSYIEARATNTPDSSRYFIPHYACIASNDGVVNTFSAGVGIPASQRRHLKGSHKSVVKPSVKDHPQVEWLHMVRREVTELRAYVQTPKRSATNLTNSSSQITSELRTGLYGSRWEPVYNEVRQALSDDSFYVQDVRDAGGAQPDVLIIAQSTESFLNDTERVRQEILAAHAAQEKSGGSILVGICAIGKESDSIRDLISSWIPNKTSGSFYIEVAEDSSDLYKIMRGWMQSVISRDPRRTQLSSKLEKILDLPPDPYDTPGRDLL
ncbi:alpha/beta hydrolase [Kitasatospora sp. YST-16]|uniref:esterase/lipase family protein n=1 Tax=Kitasatospora sp. YST-16 TaxID=2998080 RepID=UPI00228478D1|nr:alpha/beta hydrolase [Kitasatospora sp. YST-16]WAL70494.1 alpha/beta hydrolase [Kitasatospora sp. YST-16]